MELKHKQSHEQKTYQELLQAWMAPSEFLGRKTERKFTLTQKLFYEQGNKSSKLLARAWQALKAATTVHIICTPQNCILDASTDITTQFEQYYTKL